jgi:murein DD-endopeptidase MepM/ murein hydrolase activator NlpD
VVTLDGKPVPVDAAGHFLLGFGRDAAAHAILVEGTTRQTLSIAKRDWPIQRIDGLPPAKVSPDPGQLSRIRAENQLIAERRAIVGPRADYLSGVVAPAAGIVSGVFGSQRILNGEARAPHSGTDIAAATGAPVRAIAAGTVSLVHADMFFTGKTVMIDHGLGLQSVYAHLSRVEVSEGQRVGKGEGIGAVGASGRATGPHLHWGASWLDVRLDPETVQAVLEKD